MDKRAERLWIFDLDNTLHDARPHIFPQINRAMTEYIARHLEIDEGRATAIRQEYWNRYGATLLGLTRHHAVNPRHFLRETHQFPALSSQLVFDKALKSALRRLDGRRVIFSNAPRHYVDAVLDHTGIARLFDAVYAIEQVRFRPKPDLWGFREILRRERFPAAHAVMVEDCAVNLKSAKRLGMKTVWVGGGTCAPAHVDVSIPSVRALPSAARRL